MITVEKRRIKKGGEGGGGRKGSQKVHSQERTKFNKYFQLNN